MQLRIGFRLVRRVSLLSVFAAVLLLARPVHALNLFDTCTGANPNKSYKCLETQLCIDSGGGPGAACNLDPNPPVCCELPPVAPPPAVTCVSQGGHCYKTNPLCPTGEGSAGTFDCPPDANSCCVPESVKAPVATPGAAGGATAAVQQGSILLPPCTKTGNCSIDDIINTGVSFANFLFGLSGALFFAIFIYGGAMYLLSFGNAKMVSKGTDAIKGAAIGMVLVMGAWTIVRYVAGTVAPEYFLKGQGATSSGQKQTCEQQGQGWSCQSYAGATPPDVLSACQAEHQCKTLLCSGDFHTLCSGPK